MTKRRLINCATLSIIVTSGNSFAEAIVKAVKENLGMGLVVSRMTQMLEQGPFFFTPSYP
jgi:hypothetical protein